MNHADVASNRASSARFDVPWFSSIIRCKHRGATWLVFWPLAHVHWGGSKGGYAMSFTWTEEETLKLIELWGEDSVQVQINGCKRNAQILEKIVEEMQEEGYEKSSIQCRENRPKK